MKDNFKNTGAVLQTVLKKNERRTIVMSGKNKLNDEQLKDVAGGKGYEQDGEWVISGQNVNVSKDELQTLAEKDPSQLNSYEKAILEQAKKKGLI